MKEEGREGIDRVGRSTHRYREGEEAGRTTEILSMKKRESERRKEEEKGAKYGRKRRIGSSEGGIGTEYIREG